MKLLTLTLENFQGVKSLTLDFGGRSAAIYGRNGAGKTTVASAVTWLLFDRDSDGTPNYRPKPKDETGAEVHYLTTVVEGVFEDGDRAITLRKEFSEVYKQKRGSLTDEFSGHTTAYSIDGVPTSQTEYVRALEDICGGAEVMKLLTLPAYFPAQLSKDARRRLLLEVCGDISDAEVIASEPELSELAKLLASGTRAYAVEEYRKIVAANRAKLNKELEYLPSRIDEAARSIPDLSALDGEDILTSLRESAVSKRETLREERAAIRASDSGVADLRRQRAEIETKLAEAKSARLSAADAANADTRAKIDALYKTIAQSRVRLSEVRNAVSDGNREVNLLTERLENLRKQYSVQKAAQFREDEQFCPICKRPYEESDITGRRDAFNLEKSRILEEITEKSKSCSEQLITEKRSEIAEKEAEAARIESEISAVSAQTSELTATLIQPPPFETTTRCIELTAELERLKASERDDAARTSELTAALDRAIAAQSLEVTKYETDLAKYELAKTQRDRVAELDAEQKELTEKLSAAERGIYLCELFSRVKAALLTDAINGKFKHVRFALFKTQINGGIEDTCEVLVPTRNGLINYGDGSRANKGARLIAEFEILEVLSKHFGRSLPVMFDNAEALTEPLESGDLQVISLFAREGENKLRLETHTND
jgi:DNA repair exonuclease SbcCD ATPase subunit